MASAQQAGIPDRSVHLDVVVAGKSGDPVGGLHKEDFTLLDNKAARTITSFREVSGASEDVKVIVIIDAVNLGFDRMAYSRSQVEKFLKANGGRLDHPTTVGILTDKGTQIEPGFSRDGNALSDALEHNVIGLREINRSTGFWGADERTQISLTAVHQLTGFGLASLGRKIVLWVSPGWPLLSGPGVELDGKQQKQIFNDVASVSTLLRQAHMTFYDINPLGPQESLLRADYYRAFVKGVSKPSQTDLADLGLQVLAVQSGGFTIESNSDIAGGLQKCVREMASFYEIAFDEARAEQPNEYHHVEVQVDKAGLMARTRDGYYARP